MKGIRRLQVPGVVKTPKLFIITLSKNSIQKRFTQVAFTLEEAISKCWHSTDKYTIHNYICHNELSVDEINRLFKNY